MTEQEENRLDHLEADVTVLKDDVAVLKSDVAVLKSDVAVLKNDVTELKVTVGRVESKLSEILTEFKNFDVRIDTYQKAYQQVVNLAFGLIITAVAAIVIPAVLGK